MSLPGPPPGAAAAAAVVALLAAGAVPALSPGVQATHEDPDPDDWQVFTRVDATVVDNYAVVNVTAEIREGGPDPQFPFAVRVPQDAYVTGLAITRGNRTYEGTVEPQEVARARYQEHRADHGTAGLVEARDRSTYRYLVNVEEGASVTATLTYETYLEATKGVYTLPLEAPVSGFGTDRGAAFDVTVRHRAGVSDAWGTPEADASQRDGAWQLHHRVGPRSGEAPTPFNVSYTLPATGQRGSVVTAVENGTGYFAHRFEAPADARTLPVDVALALDTSGSMSGLKIRQLRDAARGITSHLDPEDRLRLVPFASVARSPWTGYRPVTAANRSDAVRAVDRLVATGSTNVEDAIRTALAASDNASRSERDALGVVVFLTDGRPTAGLEATDALRGLSLRENDAGARVFGIAFGDDADWGLVHGLADDGGGAALRVPAGEGAEVDLSRFLRTLTAPVLRNLTVDYDGEVTAHHPSAPVLFAGSELLVVGTYPAERGNITGDVTARSPDGPVERSFREPTREDGPSVLPDLVAYHRIRSLEDRVDAVGPRPDLVQRLRNLSLEHGVVTDVTSLVVTVPGPDETREVCEGCEPDRGQSEGPVAQSQAPAGSQQGSGPSRQRGSVGGAGSGSSPDAGGGSGSGASGSGSSGSGSAADDADPWGQDQPPRQRSGSDDALEGGEPGAVPGPGALVAAAAAVLAARARRRS